jgi:SAM-dependent methyltransferase
LSSSTLKISSAPQDRTREARRVVDRVFSEPRLAALYDAVCSGRPDFAFYLPLVMGAERVLDIGCGTGQLLRDARASGHMGRLCGVDPADAMLHHARERTDVDWILGDVHSVDLGERFDLVVMTGHAFQALLVDDDIASALVAIRALLAPDGRLAFETRNPLVREWERWTADDVVTVIDDDGGAVHVAHDVHRVEGELVSFTTTYVGDRWPRVERSRSTLRFIGADALSAHLTAAGLSIDQRLGDWGGRSFSDTSPEIITIARRAVAVMPDRRRPRRGRAIAR